jgi:uncharacterized protein GlcG (DUF336 family)
MLANFRTLTRLGCPILLGLIVIASGTARGQGSGPVVDGAGMFSEDAIRRAKAEIAKIERLYLVDVTAETVESLKGLGIDEVAIRKAEQSGHKGIFILIAKQDHKVEALASPRALQEELGKARLIEIREVFVEEFRQRRFDEGLLKGIQTAEKALASTRPVAPSRGGFLPSTSLEGTSLGSSPLVLRQQVRLSLAGARKAIEGAEAKAIEKGWKMNIAAVDDGGHLIAFERMDGARPASVATATTKAVTAATYRQATGPLGPPGASPDVLLNVSLQNASGGKITTLLGGVPIVVDGQVIGALGVGGGTGEQDAEVAKAGVAAFLEGLQAKPEESKSKPKDGDSDPKPKDKEGDPKPKENPASEVKPF